VNSAYELTSLLIVALFFIVTSPVLVAGIAHGKNQVVDKEIFAQSIKTTSIPDLTYNKIDDITPAEWWISVDDFSEQMKFLNEYGHFHVTQNEILNHFIKEDMYIDDWECDEIELQFIYLYVLFDIHLIEYRILEETHVRIEVNNLFGQKVRILVDGQKRVDIVSNNFIELVYKVDYIYTDCTQRTLQVLEQ